jgi:hypothetical protein
VICPRFMGTFGPKEGLKYKSRNKDEEKNKIKRNKRRNDKN